MNITPEPLNVTLATTTAMRKDAGWLALVALALRVAMILWAWDEVPPTADGSFYHVVAERIAQGHGYTWQWPDGVVTYAAHYPVGYPALMGVIYFLVGPVPGAMMLFNALLSAVAVYAIHGLCAEVIENSGAREYRRAGSLLGSSLVVFSPSLIAYTPALMTEGAVGAILVISARLALELRLNEGRAGRRWQLLTGMILSLAIASLFRPQSIVLAPIVAWLSIDAGGTKRFVRAAVVSTACLLVMTPWTLRNCDKMERCVFVSANGGWNLLIGTFEEGRGAWVPLEGERVPQECREVFQEAAKDKCFGHVGIRRITQRPISWLAMAPAKLRATFDYTAAASEYLSAAGALSEPSRKWLARLEVVSQRIFYALALLGVWGGARWGSTLRHGLLALGLLGFGGLSATLGWASTCLLFLGSTPILRLSVGGLFGMLSVLITAGIHVVFFGAGRYSFPLLFAVAPLSALGCAWIWKYRARARSSVEDFDTRPHSE